MTLSELHTYPIKSARGIELQSAHLESRGLRFDRRWMVVDRSGVFLSQRTFPKMALVSVQIESDHLRVTAAGMDDLIVSTHLPGKNPMSVRVWDDTVSAVCAGNDAENWFSKYLGIPCRLVFMPEECERIVKSDQGDIVSFADAFPLLIISQASLDDLNGRLDRPVPMNRFRPNIVVKGSEPYTEDEWKRIKIGNVVLRLTKKCDRCVTTTVNQTSGIAGKEPLATLAKYRKMGERVFFGRNAVPEKTGRITVGDPIEVIE